MVQSTVHILLMDHWKKLYVNGLDVHTPVENNTVKKMQEAIKHEDSCSHFCSSRYRPLIGWFIYEKE